MESLLSSLPAAYCYGLLRMPTANGRPFTASGFPEAVNELIRLVLDRLVEHRLRVIVRRAVQRRAFAIELQTRRFEVALHHRRVDAMHRVNGRERVGPGRGDVVDDDDDRARLERGHELRE